LRALFDEIKRSISGKGFFSAVALVFLMYFIDGNQTLDQHANVISLLDLITDVGAFTWLVPCVGTLCHAGSFVSEFRNGCVRYIYIRGGTVSYTFRKCVSVFVSAFLAISLGILLYGVYAYMVCKTIITPDVLSNYVPYKDTHSFDILIADGHPVAYILIHTALRGLAAGMWSVAGFCLSTMWKNGYIAVFSPTVILYFKDYVWSRFSFYPRVTLKSMEMGSVYAAGVVGPLLIIVGSFAAVSLMFSLFTYFSLKRGCESV